MELIIPLAKFYVYKRKLHSVSSVFEAILTFRYNTENNASFMSGKNWLQKCSGYPIKRSLSKT